MDKLLDVQGNIVSYVDTTGKEIEKRAMSASDIQAIHIDNCTVKKFFKKIDTKRIRITGQIDKPIEVYANKIGDEAFNEVSAQLIEFAKKYHIAYRTPEDGE